MWRVFFLAWALTACGSDSGGDSAAPPPPAVKNVLLLIGTCDESSCKAVGSATLTDEDYDQASYGLFYNWTPKGLFSPACTAENTTEGSDGVFALPDQPYNIFLTLRACILNRATGEFDEGMEAVAYTPTK